MRKADWIPVVGMTFIGASMVPWHPGAGVALVTVTLGTTAFAMIMKRATRFDGI